MKNVISRYLLLVVTGFMIISCSKTDDYVRVSLHQMQVPVLKFKKNNPVLQIKLLTSEDTLSHNVTSVAITTEGTEDITDIKTFRLFYLGKDSLWTRNSEPVQFGTDKTSSGSITFKGNQRLDPGKNYFWLAYELADNANLHHKVDAGCIKVTFSGNTYAKPEMANPPVTQRIGVAVRQHMEDQVHTYRIPGIATTNKGTLLAIYDVRRESSRDLQGDIDIGVSICEITGTEQQREKITDVQLLQQKIWVKPGLNIQLLTMR